MAVSQCRQNYHEDCEAGVNRHINLELYAGYTYQAMSFYFNRDDVALPGAHRYFKKASEEEREHAERLMKFQNQRGGRVKLNDVKAPERDEWGSLLDAFTVAMILEKKVNESLLALHATADCKKDPQMCDYVETHYLTEQVEAIKEIGDHITNLKRVCTSLGEYIYDRETLKGED
uniref:Ferritin n=1 Tax=Acaudina leucoprocta TaxID=1173697 RepID=K7DVN6_9ECHN|nr:ferritin [Acaudina leucoprocta]